MLLNEHVDNHNHGVCMIEHCLTLVRKSSNQFIFNDDLCSNQRYFICEERVEPEVEPDYSEETIVPAIEHDPENKLLLTDDTLTTTNEPIREEPMYTTENESESDESNDGSENIPAWWPYIKMDQDSLIYTRR